MIYDEAVALSELQAAYERKFWERAVSETKRCWLPRRCHSTKKILWFRKAVRSQSIVRYDLDITGVTRWYDKKEFFRICLTR